MLSPFAKGCGSEVTTDLAELPLFAGASNAQENLPLGSDSSVAGGDSQDIQREGEEARPRGRIRARTRSPYVLPASQSSSSAPASQLSSGVVDAMADLAVNDPAAGSRNSRPRRGRAPAPRYPINTLARY